MDSATSVASTQRLATGRDRRPIVSVARATSTSSRRRHPHSGPRPTFSFYQTSGISRGIFHGTPPPRAESPRRSAAGPVLGWPALRCSCRDSTCRSRRRVRPLAWWWLVPVLLFGCVNLWLRAVRWGVLLAPAAPLPTAQLLGVGVSAALAGLEPADARRRCRQGAAGDPPARRQADRRGRRRAARTAGRRR